MFNIMIRNVPQGEAPLRIREAWLGIVLPCTGKFPADGALGVLTQKPVDREEDGYYVPQAEALEILARIHPTAAAWWREHGHPKLGHSFIFYENEVAILGKPENKRAWG